MNYFDNSVSVRYFCKSYRSFGGKPTAEDYMNELQTLADQIGDSARYENAYYFFAGYDSPYKVSDRHNEVWLKALWAWRYVYTRETSTVVMFNFSFLFFFLHFYRHKFCFINRNVGFFLVKLLLVSIHLFRIIEKSLGLFRQADLQNGKGREMLRMCLVEWRMLIKMKLINHWVFYSIFKLGGKQLPLNQVHCQMPCKHTCISIFRNV